MVRSHYLVMDGVSVCRMNYYGVHTQIMTLSAPYVARPEHRRISLHTYTYIHICTYPISTYLIDGQIKVNMQRFKKNPQKALRVIVVPRGTQKIPHTTKMYKVSIRDRAPAHEFVHHNQINERKRMFHV